MKQVAIDTGVWVEAISRGSEFYSLARRIINEVLAGKIKAVITSLTATEVYYVAYRVYRASGLDSFKAKTRALNLFNVLYTHDNIEVLINREISLRAAEIKIKYNIALSDSYILSIAKILSIPVVFRHPEKEMVPNLSNLKKEFKIIFLSEI